ncbi:hypothetical protein EV702DRAFT_533464 [Suillus placidus]|uniref:Uncharacterized protein n=1 Tax=Suillus placidus TaxID=48579 RepID=A0A9P6ZPL9_9AGAM|nr:hypothetical protein EV702DRAFT_533464 [Suillus placidus]
MMGLSPRVLGLLLVFERYFQTLSRAIPCALVELLRWQHLECLSIVFKLWDVGPATPFVFTYVKIQLLCMRSSSTAAPYMIQRSRSIPFNTESSLSNLFLLIVLIVPSLPPFIAGVIVLGCLIISYGTLFLRCSVFESIGDPASLVAGSSYCWLNPHSSAFSRDSSEDN